MNGRRRLKTVGAIVLMAVALGLGAPVLAMDEVGRIREKCEEFFEALVKSEYNLYVKGKSPNYARYYSDFSYLFKPKKVRLLRERAASSSDPRETRAMNLLATALSVAAVRSHAAADMDQMYEFMMTADVPFDGQSVSFGEVRRTIAMEENRDRRRQMYIALNSPLEPLKVFKTGALSKMEERLGEWGFESYLQMLTQLKELEPEALESMATEFLESTDSLYAEELARLSEEHLGLDLRRARGYDIPYILGGSWLDGDISSDNAAPIAKDTFEKMGLKADGARLEFKQETFCGESVTGKVFPVRVPDEIKTCYSGLGGTRDLAAHLYMRGKAEYISSIDQPRYFELGRLGNLGLYEAAGLLFQDLMSNERWLTGVAGLDPEVAAAVARHGAFVSLFEARRSCVSTLLQIAIYSGAEDPGEIYGELVGRYMKWDPVLDKSRVALEMNDLDSAFKMEGYILAAQLRNALEEKFGEEWFQSREAGTFLKEMWRPGQETTIVDAAGALGYDGIDPSFLVADVTSAMGGE